MLSVVGFGLGGVALAQPTVSSGPFTTVTLLDGRLKISERAVAPGKLTLMAVNDGKLAHGLAITGAHLPSTQTPAIGSGKTGMLTVTVRAGKYRVWDPVRTTRRHSTLLTVETPCSRSTLNGCPASYFKGPLGKNNLIPAKPGAFLIDAYGGIGTGWSQMRAGVLQRERDIGRKFDGIGFHYGGSDRWGGVFGMSDPSAFSPRVEQWIHDQGSYPLITWTPDYTITQINHGAADAIFAKAAGYWKTFKFPIMLRVFDEFDNPVAPYAAVPDAANHHVNSCGKPFITAWRRMVDIFRSKGASNVGFWWVPEEGVTRSCVNRSYPGDAYVDWVGSDWFNSCRVGSTSQYCTPLHSGWASFNEIFNYTALGSTLSEQHDLWGPHKPFVIGETGTWNDSRYPADKGDWFRGIPSAAKKMLYLRGVALYDADVTAAEGGLNNFRVDYPTSDSSAYAGFKKMADDPWFKTR